MSHVLQILKEAEETGPTGKGTVLHSRTLKSMPHSTSPVKKQIIHDPTTGSKKAYEVWMHYTNFPAKRKARFKTVKAALGSMWWQHGD